MKSDFPFENIPHSQSDKLLHSQGYDLIQEYVSIVQQLPQPHSTVIELATGTGRMCTVLSHFFQTVITGDISLLNFPRAQQRIPKQYLERVNFLQLNMERLPFCSGSIPTIVCTNTLHEVENPKLCLQEMIRAVRSDGILVVGDFNNTGFEVMQKIHETVYHNNHNEGSISLNEIEEILRSHFRSVTLFSTPLNLTFFAESKI